ncbi:MAG: Cof-type HAD-IIB family hydrolase [Chloroflexi bacterium]|nr:Cof-type HAD-IIB family hydrolase [Chloroflexota bacterium]
MADGKGLPFDLLALDVDGTICDYSSRIGDRTKRAIQTVEARGATIVIATGRRWPTAIRVIEPLEVCRYLIQSNGAVVRRIADKAVLNSRFIPHETAAELFALFRANGVIGVWYDIPGRSHKLFVDGETSANRQLQLYSSSNPPAFVRLDSFSHLADAMHLVVFGEESALHSVLAELEATHSDTVRAIQWQSPRLEGLVLEVLAKDASKGWGLAWLAGQLGIDRDRVIAIGDDVNDIEMLRWAGTGIAMGNATGPAKAAADLVIGHVDEGGLAEYLESVL